MPTMKTVAIIAILVGIILASIGVYQWQTGLNLQEPTLGSFVPTDRLQAGQSKETMGLAMLVFGGGITIGGIVVFLKKRD